MTDVVGFGVLCALGSFECHTDGTVKASGLGRHFRESVDWKRTVSCY